MARNNVQYTADIYDEGWSGSITSLKPGDNPFSTQEVKSENAFSPVRSSTGYIRFIVEDLTILDQFMCKKVDDRYITLSHVVGSTTIIDWQGYVQSQTFQCNWQASPYEIEYPIVSALGILEETSFLPQKDIYTIGYVLKTAMSHGYMDFTKWHTPYRGATHDFLAKINDAIFFEKDYEEWVKYVGYNTGLVFPEDKCKSIDVISEICKYFGWTLYERGTELFFVSVNGTTSYQYGLFSNITSGGGITIDGTETAVPVSLPGIRSDSNNRKFLKGYGYFEITESLDTPSNPVNFDLTQATPADEVARVSYADSIYVLYNDINDGNIIAMAENVGDVMTISGYGAQLVRAMVSDEWILFVEDNEERSNLAPGIALKNGAVQKTAKFESVGNYCGRCYTGGLALSGKVDYYDGVQWTDVPEDSTIEAKIEWGEKHLIENAGAYTWTTNPTPSTVTVKLVGGLNGGHIIVGQSGGTLYVREPKDMFYIPVDNDLYGKLKVTFYTKVEGSTSNKITLITNIKLEAYKPNIVTVKSNTDFSKNVFRKTSAMAGNDVFSQDNLLCTGIDAGQCSDKLVLANDMQSALATNPEIDTINRMASMYGEPKEQIVVGVDSTPLEPYDPVTIDGDDYFNASTEMNWRNSQCTMQLQKLPSNS